MKKDETRTLLDVLNELVESGTDLTEAIRGTARRARTARRLRRPEERSRLIEVGLTLVALPDPIVSNVTGGVLIAAGLVQEGIRRRILHVDDVLKTFQNMMRELRSTKEQV